METLAYKFVKSIPDEIENLTLYISMEYGTAIHKCICGCGNEVVTPFSPTDWELSFNGESVSLNPSIGNWGFKCQSHYWIIKNQVHHSSRWTYEEITSNRKFDKKIKEKFYSEKKINKELIVPDDKSQSISKWNKCKDYFMNLF